MLFRLLSAAVLFLGLVQVLAILFSLMRVGFSQPVALTVLALAAGGALVFHRLLRRGAGDVVPVAETISGPARFSCWLLPLLLTLLLAVLANSYLHPYVAADCATYHLPTIHYWSERGYVHWVDLKPFEIYYTDMFINGYPKAAELMAFVTIHATGVTGMVHLLNAWFLLIGIGGVAYMSRRLGASAPSSLVAGLLYALAPVNIQQLNGSYVDSAFAAAVVALLAVLFRIAERRNGDNLPWSIAIIFGASAGLVLGIKGIGPLPVGITALAAVILLGMSLWKFHRGRLVSQALRAAAWLTLAAAVILLVGGYWYARNAVHTGNPLYPAAVKVGKILDWPGPTQPFTMNEAANIPVATAGWSDWKRVIYDWLQGGPAHWPFSVCSVSGRLGGLGLIWLFGCIPAIGMALYASRRKGGLATVRRPLLAGCFVATCIFLLTPMQWWARYTLWLLGLGLPCLVVVLERLRPGWARRWGALWLLLLLFFFLVELLFGFGWVACANPVDWYGGMGSFPPRPQIMLSRLAWSQPFTAVNKANQGSIFHDMMSNYHPVAVGPLNSNDNLSVWMKAMFGTVCDPLGRRPVRLLKPSKIASDNLLRRFVRDEKIGYIVWEANTPYPPLLDVLSVQRERVGEFCYFKINPHALSVGGGGVD
ncbi:MAG: hypothetical protein NTW38_12880 [Candidatus Aminicenantes bacterium]|nr:hypothetical protein [Candidatus Aminicenantes bacterium]